MPPAPINLEPFRAQSEPRIAAGQTHAKIREWLATEGIQIGRNAFSQRCVAWEALLLLKKLSNKVRFGATVEGYYGLIYVWYIIIKCIAVTAIGALVTLILLRDSREMLPVGRNPGFFQLWSIRVLMNKGF